MTTIKALHERGVPVYLRSTQDVSEFIGTLRAESVEFECPLMTCWLLDGDEGAVELGVGVNGDTGALYFSSRELRGPFYSTGPLTGGGEVVYEFQEHERPMPASSQLPLAVVEAAAVEFLTLGGGRPTSVRWQTID